MENYKNTEMYQQIMDKLGFDIQEYNSDKSGDAHERDNIPNPFDKLSLEELIFLRENNYFLPFNEYKRMGNYVSMLLRHHPEEAGVILDEHGWADVADLIEKVNPRYPLTEEILHEIAFAPDKQRYEFSEDGKRIRAVHGHSIDVDLGYEEVEPPEILYHGTAEKYAESIEAQGLIKKERQYVHLSEFISQAEQVGRRHGKLVLYKVYAKELYEDGLVFYRSSSGVWLTDSVPVKYLERMG